MYIARDSQSDKKNIIGNEALMNLILSLHKTPADKATN